MLVNSRHVIQLKMGMTFRLQVKLRLHFQSSWETFDVSLHTPQIKGIKIPDHQSH